MLVSAFIASGPPSRVLEEVVQQRLALALPGPVLGELKRVLIEKLGVSPARWDDIAAFVVDLAGGVSLPPKGPAAPITGDPADDVILDCAVANGVDLLVSGDRRHLLPVGTHLGVRILTPQALLAELAGT